jgi:acetyl esterase/lipase
MLMAGWRAACLVLLLSIMVALLGSSPMVAAQDWADPRYTVSVESGIVFTEAGGVKLKLDLYVPTGAPRPMPVVIASHGGAWLGGSRIEMTSVGQYLATRGYAVVASDYRYAPAAQYPTQIDDTRAALRWVRDHADDEGLDLTRVVMMGNSAGAQLVALTALTPVAGDPPIRAVIDCYGPMDFTVPATDERSLLTVQLYLGATREEKPALYRDASPITHVSATSPPFFITHGTADSTVPFSQSERMVAALQHAGVRVTFLPFEKADHNLALDGSPYRDRVYSEAFAFLQDVCPL